MYLPFILCARSFSFVGGLGERRSGSPVGTEHVGLGRDMVIRKAHRRCHGPSGRRKRDRNYGVGHTPLVHGEYLSG